MARLETDMTHIKEKLEENKEDHEKIFEKVDAFIKAADTKYATKERVTRIEKIVYGAVGVVLTAFLSAVVYMVINIPK